MPIGCADTMAAENATIIRHVLEPNLIQNLRNGSPATDVSGAVNGSFGATLAVSRRLGHRQLRVESGHAAKLVRRLKVNPRDIPQ